MRRLIPWTSDGLRSKWGYQLPASNRPNLCGRAALSTWTEPCRSSGTPGTPLRHRLRVVLSVGPLGDRWRASSWSSQRCGVVGSSNLLDAEAGGRGRPRLREGQRMCRMPERHRALGPECANGLRTRCAAAGFWSVCSLRGEDLVWESPKSRASSTVDACSNGCCRRRTR